MTKTTETLQRLPLAKLYVAPENARYGAQDLGDLAALAVSIVEVGDLIDPLHAYPDEDGQFAVWDGGRRWHALMTLVKGKKSKLPPALQEGVPVLVSESREAAMLLSAATFIRDKMHPADEFLNYKRLFESGLSHERIAAACAVSTARVRQLLRMIAVAPEILDAFRGGELPLDMVEAFTLTADHDKQRAVLDAVRQGGQMTAWRVKQAFKSDALDPDNRWAVFVGREAYAAAGGTFLSDLFSADEDELWADKPLAMRLADEKVEAMIQEIAAEGWAWVKFISYDQDSRDYNNSWRKGLRQITEAAANNLDAEARADLGVFITQGYRGEMAIKRGWEPEKKSKDAAAALVALPAGKSDPATYGFTHSGHFELTHVATEATRVALMRNPAAAYDAMVSSLAWATLIASSTYGNTEANASQLYAERQVRFLDVEGSEEFIAAGDAWRERLGGSPAAVAETVAALSADEKAQLLAICYARTLKADEAKADGYDRKPERWAFLGWIARRAGVDMAKAWASRPMASMLERAPKATLLAVAKEVGLDPAAYADCKKSLLLTYVVPECQEKGWVPKLLRDLVAAPEAPPAPKAAKKPRKAKEAAPAALEDAPAGEEADDDLPPSMIALATGKAKPIGGDDIATA